MTFTFVQADRSADLTAGCTMGAGLTLNNWLVMAAAAYNATAYPSAPTVNGSGISTTTLLQGGSLSGSNSVCYTFWLAQVSAAMASQTALSFTAGGGGGAIALYGLEASASGSVSLDVTAVNSGAGGGSSTVGPTSGTAQSGELSLYILPVFGANPSVTAGGYTLIGDSNYCAGGYQILGAAGATPSVTATIPAADWAGGIVTLVAVNLAAPRPLVVPSLAAIQAACW